MPEFTTMPEMETPTVIDCDPYATVLPIPPSKFYEMTERKDRSVLDGIGGKDYVFASLKTHPQQGILEGLMEARVARYGENKLPDPPKVRLISLILNALQDKIIILLIFAAVVSIVLGMTITDPKTGKVDRLHGWIDGTAILISVSIVVFLASFSDYQKAKKFEALNKQSKVSPVSVIRGGESHKINSNEVVVGDLFLIETGMKIPADGIVTEVNDLRMDEGAVTGESDLIKKKLDGDCFILSGTSTSEGTGKMIVIGVGEKSFSGKLAMDTRTPPSETPLQEKLGVMADRIGYLGMAAAALTFIVLVIRKIVHVKQTNTSWNWMYLIDFLIICITIIVVAIPEGLPLAVTIALAYSMKSMMNDNCLVRVLKSCETMGGCTAICSDKTGTLTTNVMTVVQGWIAGEDFVYTGAGIVGPYGATEVDPKQGCRLQTSSATLELLNRAIALNSTAEEVMDPSIKKMVWTGNKTEHGLLGFVKFIKDTYKSVRESVPQDQRRQYPFSSLKKRMTTIVQKGNKHQIFVKGASEYILEDCTHCLDVRGVKQPMNKQMREELEKKIVHMAEQGNRTIGVAYAEEEASQFPSDEPTPAYILISILGMQDPLRAEVLAAVRHCRDASITVRMVTGDNLNTAISIAKKCEIFRPDIDLAMEGRQFRELAEKDPETFKRKLRNLRVLARSSPTDKHVLVASLMEQGEIVAVTGDGTNDAPALSLADVGFAMVDGTEIAKGASAMILMDNNFASVVNATKWGRSVNYNVRKFLQFQLTVNVVGVLLTLIGSATTESGGSPLEAVQLLWLNLIMDTLAALALATEEPDDSYLRRPPCYRGAPLLSKAMICFIVIHSIYQLTISLLIVNLGHKWFSVGLCRRDRDGADLVEEGGDCKDGVVQKTVVFNTFIWCQIFNQFNARMLFADEVNPVKGLFTRSRQMLIISVFLAGFQVFAVEVAGRFMATTGLEWHQWLKCLGFAVVELPIGFLAKVVSQQFKEYQPTDSTKEKEVDPEKVEAIITARGANSNLRDHADKLKTELVVVRAMNSRLLHRRDTALRVWAPGREGGIGGRTSISA